MQIRKSTLGLTLIEVVTSILLLSTLLVVLLTAHAKHLRQIETAHRTNIAVESTDRLLADWFTSDKPMPRSATKRFAENPDFYWRSTSHQTGNGSAWACDVITIEVFWEGEKLPLLSVQVLDLPLSLAVRDRNRPVVEQGLSN